MYSIDLAPDGRFRLHYSESVSVTIPRTLTGLQILYGILLEKQLQTAPRIGTPAQPLQSAIDELARNWFTNQIPVDTSSIEELFNAP